MSFNVNFNSNQPMIKESQKSQDGGAGNTGYFQVGEGSEEKRNQQSAGSIFSDSEEKDSFHHEGEEDLEVNFSLSAFIAKIIFSIKTFFKNLFNLK